VQQYVCHLLCVKLGDSATTTRGKLHQAFGDDAVSRAQAFHWHKIFLNTEPLLKMSSAADNHQQNGQDTTQMDKRTCSIQWKINGQNDC
jgi:hypothetical protein